MKPTLEALLEEHRERGADAYVDEHYGDDEGDELFQEKVEVHLAHCDGHDALAPLLVKAVEALQAEAIYHGSKAASVTVAEIERALTAGAKGEGKDG